ncbi:unnamed protein product [Pleuronectes platessa]|uniref:Uncharacterized protein n=1 Tax=Pleuronectes platessa TaxID=8262 RepID=A0A9N7TV75_PLEPL|nr:unnamed protein product [Pleuronectes platessa]
MASAKARDLRPRHVEYLLSNKVQWQNGDLNPPPSRSGPEVEEGGQVWGGGGACRPPVGVAAAAVSPPSPWEPAVKRKEASLRPVLLLLPPPPPPPPLFSLSSDLNRQGGKHPTPPTAQK